MPAKPDDDTKEDLLYVARRRNLEAAAAAVDPIQVATECSRTIVSKICVSGRTENSTVSTGRGTGQLDGRTEIRDQYTVAEERPWFAFVSSCDAFCAGIFCRNQANKNPCSAPRLLELLARGRRIASHKLDHTTL